MSAFFTAAPRGRTINLKLRAAVPPLGLPARPSLWRVLPIGFVALLGALFPALFPAHLLTNQGGLGEELRSGAAGAASVDVAPLEILLPVTGSTVGNGNLLLVEAATSTPLEGRDSRVEVLAGNSGDWSPAAPVPNQPLRWRFLVSDPAPGLLRIAVRAVGLAGGLTLQKSIDVQVDPQPKPGLAISDPYATPGSFTKGQLHTHSTWSFDAWNSLPPGELADEYRRLGYGFIVVTDHNVVAYTGDRNRDSSFVAIPGYESTSDSGHITGLFVNSVASPSTPAQGRIDAITGDGGIAVLGHPGWRIGYLDTDMKTLRGYSAVEIYNGMTMTQDDQLRANIAKWHEGLKANGPKNPIFAVAVDDAHESRFRNTGWVAAKMSRISADGVRQALRTGAFYASNGPSFSRIGVLDGAVAAVSPDAEIIRFIDEDLNVVAQGSPLLATYRPTEKDLFIRIEATAADGTTAWSQPFWVG